MLSRPSEEPRWADNPGGGDIGAVEPSSGKKDTGWLASERPSAGHFNWKLQHHAQWLKVLDRMVRAHTLANLQVQSGPAATDTIYDVAHCPHASNDGWGFTLAIGEDTNGDGIIWQTSRDAAGWHQRLGPIADEHYLAIAPEILSDPDDTPTAIIVGHDDANNAEIWSLVLDQTGGTSPLTPSSTTGVLRAVAWCGATTWVAVGDSGHIERTTNGGNSWSQITADASYTGNFKAVRYAGNGNVVIAGDDGEIQESSDSGGSFTRRNTSTGDHIRSLLWIPDEDLGTGTGRWLAGGVNETLLEGHGNAQSWAAVSPSPFEWQNDWRGGANPGNWSIEQMEYLHGVLVLSIEDESQASPNITGHLIFSFDAGHTFVPRPSDHEDGGPDLYDGQSVGIRRPAHNRMMLGSCSDGQSLFLVGETGIILKSPPTIRTI